MLVIPSLLLFSLALSQGARAAVIKSPRTVDPSTLLGETTSTSSSTPSLSATPIKPPEQQPSPPSSLTAPATETGVPAIAAIDTSTVDLGDIPFELSATTLTPTSTAPAASAADAAPEMMVTAAPGPPPPANEDAAREFQEAYGDRYTQVTYWSCQTRGVFSGHCGWHEPIIEIAAASSGGASSSPSRERGRMGAAARAGVVAAGVAAVFGFVLGG